MLVELSNGAQLGWSTLPGLTALLGEGVSYFSHQQNCNLGKEGRGELLFASAKLQLRDDGKG